MNAREARWEREFREDEGAELVSTNTAPPFAQPMSVMRVRHYGQSPRVTPLWLKLKWRAQFAWAWLVDRG